MAFIHRAQPNCSDVHRTFRDATKALEATFSAPKVPPALPGDCRRLLQAVVDERDGKCSDEDSRSANAELRNFWEKHVGENPAKLAVFAGVLRELQPVIVRDADVLEWWQQVVKPVVTGTGYRKAAIEDAREFLVRCMVPRDDDSDGEHPLSATSRRLLTDLLNLYISRTRTLTEDDPFLAAENAQVSRHVESVLVAFGRRRPNDFYQSVNDLVVAATTRLQGLILLSIFLSEPAPHLYVVRNTPLIKSLLRCLLNDTSMSVVAAALTCVVMLIPLVPGDIAPLLPQMFIIYGRLLCWTPSMADNDQSQSNIDADWDRARPSEDPADSAAPDLMTYFTYLYGLYPLNFLSYVHDPRRFLERARFARADQLDHDPTEILRKTEPFRQVHLLHPNFINLSIEEELVDPKWTAMDPSDVVAECHALCIHGRLQPNSPGPPPTAKLPELPSLQPRITRKRSIRSSPISSHPALLLDRSSLKALTISGSAKVGELDSPSSKSRAPQSDDDTQPDSIQARSEASQSQPTSPNLNDFPSPGGTLLRNSAAALDAEDPPSTNLAFLQREVADLRSKVSFEKWQKASYSQHIGRMMSRKVKDATDEAQVTNLVNESRELEHQISLLQSARQATIKDSELTREQATSLEASLTERLNKMKQEQQTWRVEAEELRRLRTETRQYREILVATEARELNKSHQLETAKREVEKLRDIQKQLNKAEQKLREYEYHEWEFGRAKREQEILTNEKQTMQMKLQRLEQDRDHIRKVYSDRIAELEAQLEDPESARSRRTDQPSPNTQFLIQQAAADSNAKLMQLKKAYSRLLAKYTELELEYQAAKAQLDALQGHERDVDPAFGTHFVDTSDDNSGGQPDSAYETLNDYNAVTDSAYTASTSDPTGRRFQAPERTVSTGQSEATLHSGVGLAFKKPPSRGHSMTSRSSGVPAIFNQTAPLSFDNKSVRSAEGEVKKKEKIKPDSQVRVYGRGGAQNIKLKAKDKDKDRGEDGSTKPFGALMGLKRLV